MSKISHPMTYAELVTPGKRRSKGVELITGSGRWELSKDSTRAYLTRVQVSSVLGHFRVREKNIDDDAGLHIAKTEHSLILSDLGKKGGWGIVMACHVHCTDWYQRVQRNNVRRTRKTT